MIGTIFGVIILLLEAAHIVVKAGGKHRIMDGFIICGIALIFL